MTTTASHMDNRTWLMANATTTSTLRNLHNMSDAECAAERTRIELGQLLAAITPADTAVSA